MNKFQYHKEGAMPKTESVFVYSSNLAGIHNKGSAKTAMLKFGAKYGRGIGISGTSYGIPTKDHDIVTLPLDIIETYIMRFIKFSKELKNVDFFVTAIGTGLIGYPDNQIAPLFKTSETNCNFPEQWRPFLEL
jgi:hypothetical protein